MPNDNGDQSGEIDTYKQYRKALIATRKAIGTAKKGRAVAVDDATRAELDEKILELEEQVFKLKKTVAALIDNASVISPPSKRQVEEIAALTGEVEQLTNDRLTASAAVALAGRALTMASGLAKAG